MLNGKALAGKRGWQNARCGEAWQGTFTSALMEDLLIPLTLIGLAAVMLGLAWMALGEFGVCFERIPNVS